MLLLSNRIEKMIFNNWVKHNKIRDISDMLLLNNRIEKMNFNNWVKYNKIREKIMEIRNTTESSFSFGNMLSMKQKADSVH